MKKLIALLLALSLVMGLVGCGSDEPDIDIILDTVTRDFRFEKSDFSIIMPAYTVDASPQDSALAEPYLFEAGDITVRAKEQPKEDFGYDMTAEEYAQTLVATNGYNCSVDIKDGLPCFTFTSYEDGLTYLYTTAISDNSFWFINASCAIDAFEKYQHTMWSYLMTARVSASNETIASIPTVPDIAVGSIPDITPETTSIEGIETDTDAVYETIQDLRIQAPANGYTDVTDSVESDQDFVFMITDTILLLGKRHTKSSLAPQHQSPEDFAQFLIDAYKFDSTLEYRDGILTFVYPSPDGEFTYLGVVLEGTESLWYLQGYTFTKDFENAEAEMWQYLRTAQVE